MVRIWIATSLFLALTPLHASGADAPTFAHDVAPIVYKYCASCHQAAGVAPFALISYEEVRRHARQIAEASASRYMPPWKAEAPSDEFVGQPRPTDAEIDTLRRWADGGAPLGKRSELPPPPAPTGGWQLGRPDLELTLPQPYILPAEGSDVFRVFVIPIPGALRRYVRTLEFRPGNPRVIHHVNIRVDTTPASRERDAADPLPGYDGLLARTALFPDGHFLGWTPGQVAPPLPRGLAWPLEAGSDLVLQVHMRPDGKPEPVNFSVGFQFGDDPPERRLAMLRLSRQDLDIPPGEPSFIVSDSYVLPVDVDVQAVQPHAHYRARDARGEAVLPDGRVVPLIVIRHWDFRWQHLYRYKTPLHLPKGTRLTMTFTFDNSAANSANPVSPPARAVWGQRTEEEMSDLWVQVLTSNEQDLLALNRDFRVKAVRDDLIGYEQLIRRTPDEIGLHDDAAVLYLEEGEPARAADHWRAVVALQPKVAASHFNLGTALMLAKQPADAAAEFKAAIALNPSHAPAHHSLGQLLLAHGDRAGAI
jgi:hypothetical protein